MSKHFERALDAVASVCGEENCGLAKPSAEMIRVAEGMTGFDRDSVMALFNALARAYRIQRASPSA